MRAPPPTGCSCSRAPALEAAPRLAPRGSYPTPKVNLAALREALGADPTIIEAAEAMDRGAKRGTGKIGANVAVMWRYFTTSVYRSGDLAMLATREALQNSRDACREARSAGKIRTRRNDSNRPEPWFKVTWDARDKSLTWEDNGIGMDEATIRAKFLVIGESGKTQSADAAGGFGVAKAVILGVSSTFRWEMHSRDVLVVSEGEGQDQDYYEAEPRQGTRLTVFDVKDEWKDNRIHGNQHVVERIRNMLVLCDPTEAMRPKVGDPEPEGGWAPMKITLVTIDANGWAQEENIEPAFSRRGGSVLVDNEPWSASTALVKAYRRGPGDHDGGFFVRLGGLIQFEEGSARGTLKTDVVIDLRTHLRPGDARYPLNAARDALTWPTSNYYTNLREVVERENAGTSKAKDDEVIDPDDWGTSAQGEEVGDATREAFETPEFQAALRGTAGSLRDFYAERAKYRPKRSKPSEADDPSGAAAVSTEAGDHLTGAAAEAQGFAAATTAVEVLANDAGEARDGKAAAVVLREVFRGAVAIGDEAVVGRLSDGDVGAALTALSEGDATPAQVRTLASALDDAERTHEQANGGGVLGFLAVDKARDALVAGSGRAIVRPSNPFGRLAGLRISRASYDRGRARRFLKSYAKWVPYLVAWDGALRLVAQEAKVRARFRPGFVLDDTVLAKVASSGWDRSVIYIAPDPFAAMVKAHRTRPEAVAIYLHNLACHELTHLDGRMGDGHDEEFVAAREDIAAGTAHMVAPLTVLVTTVLGLPRSEKVDAKEAAKLAAMLDAARKARDTYRVQLRRFEAECGTDTDEPEADTEPAEPEADEPEADVNETIHGFPVTWHAPTAPANVTMATVLIGPEGARIALIDGRLASLANGNMQAVAYERLDPATGWFEGTRDGWRYAYYTDLADDPAKLRASLTAWLATKPVPPWLRQEEPPAPALDPDALLDAAFAQVRAALGPMERAYFEAWAARSRPQIAPLVAAVLATARKT